MHTHNRNKPLYRHGKSSTTGYIWLTPNKRVAELYGEHKKGNKRNIYTYTFPRNLKLLNLRNASSMNFLLSHLQAPYRKQVMNVININRKTGKVTRTSNFNKNLIIANATKELGNKFGFNGFYNKGNRIEEEILLLNKTIPRKLTSHRPRHVTTLNRPYNSNSNSNY